VKTKILEIRSVAPVEKPVQKRGGSNTKSNSPLGKSAEKSVGDHQPMGARQKGPKKAKGSCREA